MANCYMNFSTGVFHCDTFGRLTREDVHSVWRNLPMTGCAWIEGGHLFVRDRDPEIGGRTFDLGQVADGVTRVRE